MITFDTSVLLNYYQARSGAGLSTASGSNTSSGSGPKKYAPTAPWSTSSTAPRADALVKSVLAGKRFVDENAAQLDLPGASADYKKLFALYQGLNTLTGLAERMNAKGISDTEKTRIAKLFTQGLTESTAYADALKLDQLRLTRGDAMTSDKTTVGVPKANYTYTTGTIYTGTSTDAVPAFDGNVAFTVQVKKMGVTQSINIDLSQMTGTRSMASVTTFINDKLQAAGVATRFSVNRTAGAAKTVQVGTTTVTLPASGDALAFKIAGDSAETVTFSAAATKPAVYVATAAGNPDPDKNVKTNDGVILSTLTKTEAGAAGVPGGKLFAEGLDATVKAVRATQVGPDGSVYVLADITGKIDGQTIKGDGDVALLKYDSAGNLSYARTLGAADTASGLALAVSADGKVAVAGSVTGTLQGATNGPVNSSATSGLKDSFVTLYDSKGDEVWTQRRGALQDDEATAVGFGADGTVYVGGRSKSSMPGATTAGGGWDGYLTAISTTSKGAPQTLFTKQFGTAGDDGVSGLVVNGDQVVVAGVENGKATLRSFDVTKASTTVLRNQAADGTYSVVTTTTDANGQVTTSTVNGNTEATGYATSTTSTFISSATANQGAQRDLGDIAGGGIVGLKLEGGNLYVGGSTRNGALNVGGATPLDHNGGIDGFVAQLSTNLTDTSADKLAYYGGAGDDTVTGFAVAGGQAWLTGVAGAGLDAGNPLGTKDGYLAQLNMNTGVVESATRLTGKDGIVTPTALAVDASGSSALDKLGLPKGTLAWTDSQKIVAATSARAGDQFQIRTRTGGSLATVTIDANDTLESLASKVSRAAGFKAKVEVVSSNGYRQLKISPATDNSTIEILPGKGGKDVLDAIGLASGVVRRTEIDDNGKTVSADGKGNVYGLSLSADLKLDTPANITAAQAALAKAMTSIRNAYRDLEAAAKPQVKASNLVSGPVPSYLTNQIANYQAALTRLGG